MSATPVTRAFEAVIDDVNTVKRSVVARINTSNVDRYNTVILPRGARYKNWRAAGGPVLWEHGKDPRNFTDPIANCRDLQNNGGPIPSELVAEPVFRATEFAQERFEMYRDGIVKGWSVNILPNARSASPPTSEELRSRPDWEGADLIYREWDLAEFSGVVIPGNADALTHDRAAKMLDLVARNLLWLPEDVRPLVEERGRPTPEPAECPECGKPCTAGPDGDLTCECGYKGKGKDKDGDDGREATPGPVHPVAKSAADVELGGKSIVAIAREFADERRAMKQSLRDEIMATIDLVFYGRV